MASNSRPAEGGPQTRAKLLVDWEIPSALPVRSMSAGQQRRVGLARMVLAAAPLWMLDEPFTNLDTSGQGLVRELLVEHLRRGGASVVATHQAVDLDVTTHRLRL